MLRPSRSDRQHMAAQTRLMQPARHRALQDAAAHAAMAGDDEDAAAAGGAGTHDKALQRAMRLDLGHAMQIEPRLDVALAAAKALGGGAIDPGEAVERQRGRRLQRLGHSGGGIASRSPHRIATGQRYAPTLPSPACGEGFR
jgi:hypothetical protein